MASWSDDSNQSFNRIHVAATTFNAENCNGCSDLTNHEDNKQFRPCRAVTPNTSVLSLYNKAHSLRSDSMGLLLFSTEERVHFELLDLLKNTGAPLHFKGDIYPVVFHPFVPFIVGDTEEYDKLCGHCTSRGIDIAQLCRICECPLDKTNHSLSKYPYRLPKKVNHLVSRGNLQGLQAMSQNYLHNAFDSVRFGSHNKRGIFGACPGEMLHLISLGWFKYALESFKQQAREKSRALEQYDALCARISKLLCRQSDRKLPRMSFPKGIYATSHLMRHEYAGCLMIKLIALHTSAFSPIFEPPKRVKKSKAVRQKTDHQKSDDIETGAFDKFRDLSSPHHIHDWIIFVQSLLQWLEWMKQRTMGKKMVEKSHYAMQWLIRRLKFVSPRNKGMKTLTIKTHRVLHLAEGMLDHGVPSVVNSAYAESAHVELAKVTTRRTQKRFAIFVVQSSNRYIENLAIARGQFEIMKLETQSGTVEQDSDKSFPKLDGARFIFKSCNTSSPNMKWHSSHHDFPPILL